MDGLKMLEVLIEVSCFLANFNAFHTRSVKATNHQPPALPPVLARSLRSEVWSFGSRVLGVALQLLGATATAGALYAQIKATVDG